MKKSSTLRQRLRVWILGGGTIYIYNIYIYKNIYIYIYMSASLCVCVCVWVCVWVCTFACAFGCARLRVRVGVCMPEGEEHAICV